MTLRDGTGKVLFANQPVTATNQEVTVPLEFIFTDWRLGLQFCDLSETQAARRLFIVNLSLSAVMTLVLVAGVMLALRTMAREMKLTQMKADFVANVSHELRTPIASIRVFGELLKLGRISEPAKVREYGSYIEAEGRRLTGLINKILDFSRIESGAKTWQSAPTDIKHIVAETLVAYQVQLQQKHFVVEKNITAAPLPLLQLDADAIGLALSNLLDNAIKYSGTSNKITVTVQQEEDFVEVSVADEGLGIAPSEQEKIFEKFYRVSTGLVHDVKGSGLGLSIVKHIVEAHHGHITVTSELGKGSTFTIRLPITATESEGEAQFEATSVISGQ